KVDELALSVPVARAERREDGLGREHAGEDIGEGDAGAHRLSVGLSGDRHEAALRLRDRIVAGYQPQRTVVAVSGDRAIDQARIDGGEGGVVEALTRHHIRSEVLDQNVHITSESPNDLSALGLAEVDGQASLV